MVRFGLRVPDFPIDGTHGTAFAHQLTETLAAGRGSFVSAWVADHFVPWAEFQAPMTDVHECWSTVCYLAGMFPEYTLGTIVLSQSYRSPALVAKMSATLQALTGGRLILGIGAGWKQDEYLAYGYPYPDNITRLQQMEEAVQIIRRMWTEPRATFHGQHYHIDNALCEPKPDPLPPILIGGGGKKVLLRLVAQHADWWNFPGGTLENYQDLLATLRMHCDKVGRDYAGITKTWMCECVAVAATTAEAERLAHASPFFGRGETIMGTPDEVTAQLRRFTELGVEHFMLRFADFPRTDGVRLFAQEVIPRFN